MSTHQPLAGKRILITRARHQAGRLAEALEEQGAEVLRLPTIEIVPPETYAHLDAVLEVISGFDWLIVTSANGAAALADRMQFLRIRPEQLKHLQIAAIGPATAVALGRIGLDGVRDAGRVCGRGGGGHAQGKGGGAACPAGARGRGPRRHPRAAAKMWSGYSRGRGVPDRDSRGFDRAGARIVWARESRCPMR